MVDGKEASSESAAKRPDVSPASAPARPATPKPDAQPRRKAKDSGGHIITALFVIAAVIAGYWLHTGGHGRLGRAPVHHSLREVVKELLHPDKGILAADESPSTLGKKLKVPNKPATRREWRRTLLTAPGLEQHTSGVILHEETFAALGPELAELRARGVALGIKLDTGTKPLPPAKAGETITLGLDGLEARCAEFRDKHGATFAKWRSVFRVGKHTPSAGAVRRNSADLAAFAAAAQKCGLVPIVEPEVLAEGDHDIQRAAGAAARVLKGLFRALQQRGDVDLQALLLKAALVTPGRTAPQQAPPAEVATATLRVLLSSVPKAVAGIVFLSGGQSEAAATANLLALGRLVKARNAARAKAEKPPLPWALSFSFGRALTDSALAAWQAAGSRDAQPQAVAKAQDLLLERLTLNAMAQRGEGAPGQGEGEGAAKPKRKKAKKPKKAQQGGGGVEAERAAGESGAAEKARDGAAGAEAGAQ
ncbi:hypothetical protein HYH03_011826 [Edaphochlamys debaryana]|uniref:fructose-bisphosphate aldolase n=1 Tax=Edaphochlamys debaryana TaxID=47281 RepID=A0A835XTZ7_9CHLO|nr:hypothetical protein HYH03_011826 [Edaphochlamys debaryana]|eukprot:KAG2489719.1 hypothetical protein HYH03_011826 [Edaphochlamys debaryana]